MARQLVGATARTRGRATFEHVTLEIGEIRRHRKRGAYRLRDRIFTGRHVQTFEIDPPPLNRPAHNLLLRVDEFVVGLPDAVRPTIRRDSGHIFVHRIGD